MLPQISCGWLGYSSPFVQFRIRGACCDIVGIHTTWETDTFRWIAVTVSDRFSSDATQELSVLRSVVAAVGIWASPVAVSGGPTVNIWAVGTIGMGLSVFFRFWVFGSVFRDGIYCHAIEGAEHCEWMMSRSGLRRSIITGELLMPSLLEVVSNFVGVWLFIVLYLKETGRRTDDDSLVV